MTKGPKLYQMVGLSLIIVGIMMFSGIAFATHTTGSTTNNVKGHSDLITATDVSATNACRDCHPRSGDLLDSVGSALLDTNPAADGELQYSQDFHQTHLKSVYLKGDFKGCVYCHKSAAVDNTKSDVNSTSTDQNGWQSGLLITDGSSMQGTNQDLDADDYSSPGYTKGLGSRKLVSSGLCNRCHGRFQTDQDQGGYSHGTDYTSTNPYGCTTTCHKTGSGFAPSPATSHTGVSILNASYSSSRYFCFLCHGGKSKFMTQESNADNTNYND